MYGPASQAMVPSVLDRLVDASMYHDSNAWYDEKELLASVQRDLENLLNARQTNTATLKYPKLNESIINFGLPDVSGFDMETPASRARFFRTVESVIRTFEPRVSDVQVAFIESSEQSLTKMQFRINAKLKVDQAREFAFDTTLQLSTGHFHVESEVDTRSPKL
ncbi:type VI secretion system baseplate subunit TssE [Aureliella helgolandensis]|uniref:Gene 25-like lysozyme n=1 Tax=Aureliella helgolandensis TaxID=2527968 RepID=A0A518G539_9BACT|nr:type VI secretion system baseplate subunit TssE [Aureliella helgolandensis]QDV23702.1 Gene 25-like lysozyme [Aureliella helgolandensis]